PTATALRLSAAAGGEITFTVVPTTTAGRIGIDRDEDGYYDRDELDLGSDPADASSIPPGGTTTTSTTTTTTTTPPGSTTTSLPHTDGDGVPDVVDDCPSVADPGQTDGDGDGLGDACDPCTSPATITKAKGVFAHLPAPGGNDTLAITGVVTVP